MTRHEFAAAMDDAKREALRRHLDRRPALHAELPARAALAGAWREWFDGDEYLGVRSARVAADAVGAKQRCGCDVCRGSVAP